MTQAEALHKLLKLGPLEPLFAQHVCGWPPEVFILAMHQAIQQGWVRRVRHTNQNPTLLAAVN